jgi:hypothetical protein
VTKMPLAEHNHMVKALPFRISVLPWGEPVPTRMLA